MFFRPKLQLFFDNSQAGCKIMRGQEGQSYFMLRPPPSASSYCTNKTTWLEKYQKMFLGFLRASLTWLWYMMSCPEWLKNWKKSNTSFIFCPHIMLEKRPFSTFLKFNFWHLPWFRKIQVNPKYEKFTLQPRQMCNRAKYCVLSKIRPSTFSRTHVQK